MLSASMLRITHTRGRMAPAIEHFASQRLRIGSAAGSELLFGAGEGRGVAPLHAEIRFEGSWQLVDRGAPSGTWVNGARVSRHAIRSGDVIALGGPDGPEFRVEILRMPAPSGVFSQPAPAIASGPDAEGRVDLATAERMVADAVMRATAGEDKTAAVVAAKVNAAQKRAARNNLWLTLGLGVTFVVLLGTALTIWDAHRRRSALASDVGIDREKGSKPKGSIPTQVYTGREIYEQNRAAVYLLGWTSGNKVGGACTAFAIKPDMLATNAHCVNAVKDKSNPVVTQNDSGGKIRLRVLAMAIHPGYKTGRGSADSPDVGLLRIEGRMSKIVTLANDAELRALGPGDDVFVLGFPGRVMDPLSPSATFLQGHLGRVMALGERAPETPDDATLIQHDAVTRGGNSGSPIFNQYGHVIGIHAAHLDDEEEEQVGGQKTKVVKASPFRVGMRIDLLNGVKTP
jgi:S1-C subfamily serine protease